MRLQLLDVNNDFNMDIVSMEDVDSFNPQVI